MEGRVCIQHKKKQQQKTLAAVCFCAFTRRCSFQTTGKTSASRHTCTVGQRAQVCSQTHARAHARLNNLPQAAFPIIIHVFTRRFIHRSCSSVRCSPTQCGSVRNSTATFMLDSFTRNASSRLLKRITVHFYMHLSIATQTRLNFPPSWFNYARTTNYSQKNVYVGEIY